MSKPWVCLGPVDVGPLAEWLARARPHFPAPSAPTKPQRIEAPPELVLPITEQVLRLFGRDDHYWLADMVAHRPVLSRVLPGQRHDLHVDKMRADWINRIHVPIITNEGAWMLWEEEGRKVHFEAGKAYTFNTLRRHAFGNDGPSERVHLMFDVLKGDA